MQIGAAYVILASGAFAAVGFALPSADSGSAAPVRVPAGTFPTTSPSPARTAGGVAAAPGATTRASATPSATSPPAIVPIAASSVSVSPVAAPSDANPAQAAVTVNYLVVARDDGQFEGEVTVVNNGSAPISGWQIVVALSSDQITSFWDASGYVSNNVLLLQPESGAVPLAAGGTLSVYFTAVGPQTTPDVCAFNSVSCG